MLRKLYSGLVRLHPIYFRNRFGEEMLSIFDQAEGRAGRLTLVGDAVLSLLRQWTLRPDFWQQPVSVTPVPSGAAPAFHTFEKFRPRTGALIDGAILSVIVFTGICLTMGYAWNHPVLIRIVQPYWRISHNPSAAQTSPVRVPGGQVVPAERPFYTPEGRVVLVFPSSRVNTRPDAGILNDAPRVSAQLLRSYAGTYTTEANEPIYVQFTETQFSIQEAGSSPVRLLPISETEFVTHSQRDYLVVFRADQRGTVDRLDIFRNGARLTAHRR